MNILFTASEMRTFYQKPAVWRSVVGSLAPVLAKQGHDVRVMIPLYTAIPMDWQHKMQFVLHSTFSGLAPAVLRRDDAQKRRGYLLLPGQ
jgi:glycogen synthase